MMLPMTRFARLIAALAVAVGLALPAAAADIGAGEFGGHPFHHPGPD